MFKKIFFSLLLLVLFSFAQNTQATSIGLTGYAWSPNIGWISFSGANYQVTFDTTTNTFSGYAWADLKHIGWIDFNGVSLNGGFAKALAANCAGTCTSGWDGKIHLSGPIGSGGSYGVSIGGVNNDEFHDFAWGSDVVGWVKFCDDSTAHLYCVKLGGETPPSDCGGPNQPSCADCGHAGQPSCADCGHPGQPSCTSLLSASCAVTLSGADAIWQATASGGQAPYFFDWTINGQSSNNHTGTLTFISIPPGSYTSSVRVTDANNAAISVGCTPNPFVVVGDDGVIYPTLSTINGQDRIGISSQPLSSPAFSSGIGIQASGPLSATPLQVRVLDVVSLVPPFKSLLKTAAQGGVLSGSGNQLLPRCYFGTTPYSGTESFVDCNTVSPITMSNGSQAFFNIEIHRPVQVLKDNNPYRVILGDPNVNLATHPDTQASFLFDYRVGTVNPF